MKAAIRPFDGTNYGEIILVKRLVMLLPEDETKTLFLHFISIYNVQR